MKIEYITNFETDENCYFCYDDENKGFIVDPGCDADEIMSFIEKKNLKITHILLTHCHYDHILGLEAIRKVTGALVVSSFNCNLNIQNPSVNLSGVFFENKIIAEPADILLSDGDILKVGKITVKAIETPGHTNGGLCFLAENILFSGDTLFLRSVGRSDFPTGDAQILEKSIKEKLYTLDDDIIVYPGHGNETKIYYEKRYNMYVKG